MNIRSLEALGLSGELLEIWHREYGSALLPAQAQAVSHTNLLRGGSLILYAPTGAGKTLVGEMAALQAATHGRRALFLVPTKALAEEKYALLRRVYGPLGLRVIVSTRDRRQDDGRLLRGDFDLAIAVPEKAHYLFNLSPGAARALGCVVVDELQLIGDPERGPTLEVTLAHLRGTCPELQIVGLSAVMGAPGAVAEWLGAEWLEMRQRPVELRCGVLAGGLFRYREFNTGRLGEERWPLDLAELEWEEAAARLALWLAAQGEPTLVFLPDRPSVVKMALRLAEEGGTSPPGPLSLAGEGELGTSPPRPLSFEEGGSVERRLSSLPRTATRERLQEVVAAGVAFHSSDLQFEERRLVEEAFAAGEIMILCSTSTLALGVNLPARNVILAAERWEQPGGRGRPALTPISRAEYENMGGRAGRPRLGEDFGRAILLADSAYQQEALLERYTTPGLDPPAPALGALSPLGQLTLLCGAEGGGLEDLATLYRHTLTAWTRGERETRELPQGLQAALHSAERYGLLAAAEPDRLRVTPLGRLAAGSGASLEGFYWLSRWLGAASPAVGVDFDRRPSPAAGQCPPGCGIIATQRADIAALRSAKSAPTITTPGAVSPALQPGDLSLLFLAALTPEAMALSFPLGGSRAHGPDWLGELEKQAAPVDLPLLQALWETEERSAADKARAARLVRALLRWTGDETTAEIEEAVRVPAGRLAVAAETVSWLVGLAARIGAERGWPAARVEAAEGLAARLAAGLPEPALALGQALRGRAGRDRVLALLAAGIRLEADLEALTPADWHRLIPEAEEQARLWREAPGPTPAGRRSRRKAASPPAGQAPPAGASPLLRLDARRPHRVILYGREVYLPPAEWRLLAILAAQPGRCLSRESLMEEMWEPDEMVEMAQVNWHRYRLVKKLAEALPPGEASPIRTVPRRGYCLDLPAAEVEFVGRDEG
jgi:helicase